MTPFVPATPEPVSDEIVNDTMKEPRELLAELAGIDPKSDRRITKKMVRAALQKHFDVGKVFINDKYQVVVHSVAESQQDGSFPALIHLSIRRLDREPIHDWRDLQEIKNQLVGPDHEAVELYPAESRRADSANQYHLWVLQDSSVQFPFGFTQRYVRGPERSFGESKQRAFS